MAVTSRSGMAAGHTRMGHVHTRMGDYPGGIRVGYVALFRGQTGILLVRVSYAYECWARSIWASHTRMRVEDEVLDVKTSLVIRV